MSVTEEHAAFEGVLKTKVGVMTHLAPRASRLGEAESAEIATMAQESLDRGEIRLVLDLACVLVLDSIALETFADVQDAAIRLGG